MQVKYRLDALTSLRFFAAAIIVLTHTHSYGLFGFDKDQPLPIECGQAVSFFFVLSGFILAYIYPKLQTWPEIMHFWRARIARIWPGLLASFILTFWLLSYSWDYTNGLPNLLMVNAWIPYPYYFFSYNWLTWSVSVEFFFYLAFPFIIYHWEKTWLVKLLFSGIIVALTILVSNILELPSYVDLRDDYISSTALLYIHPVTRIFEFILGICVASYWRRQVVHTQWSETRATLYEIGVILLAVSSMHFISPMATTWAGSAGSAWLTSSGSMVAFGLLIYVMAMGKGRINTW